MHRLTYVLLPAGLLLAVAAEWQTVAADHVALAVVDALVGLVLIVCGLVAWQRRPASRSGLLMVLISFSWFASNLVQAAVFLHRGPLTHLLLGYPTGRIRHRLTMATVVLAYLTAVVGPIAGNDTLALGLAALIAVTAAHVFRRASGPARRASGPALAAALAFAGVLAGGSVQRLAGWDADSAVLYAYDAVVVAVVVLLFVNLMIGRWTEATVADLVVGLGEREGTSGCSAAYARTRQIRSPPARKAFGLDRLRTARVFTVPVLASDVGVFRGTIGLLGHRVPHLVVGEALTRLVPLTVGGAGLARLGHDSRLSS